MNLNEYKGLFIFKSPSSLSHSFITQHSKTENVYMFVIANIQSFTSQIFRVVGPLGENLDFLVHWDLTLKKKLIKTPKPQALLSQSFKRNESNLIYDRVMATISKFSQQVFETYS